MPSSSREPALPCGVDRDGQGVVVGLAQGTHWPRDVCTSRVMRVEVAGQMQFRASMAYLHSSSHTTWSVGTAGSGPATPAVPAPPRSTQVVLNVWRHSRSGPLEAQPEQPAR